MLDNLEPHFSEHADSEAEKPIRAINRRLLRPNIEFSKFVKKKLLTLEKACHQWNSGPFSNIPQGYTYLTQFLMHEIASREGVNQRSWKMELDSLYGEGAMIDGAGRFVCRQPAGDIIADLPRRQPDKKALIPEFRNDDHLIIAQLHLLFQQFHNRVMEVMEKIIYSENIAVNNLFNQTKQYVTATFHRIVNEDLLPKLTHPAVYEYYRSKNSNSYIYIDPSEPELPYEMTHAALRFGHSMVRKSYNLNTNHSDAKNTKLEKLFELTGEHSCSAYCGADKSLSIQWGLFFNVNNEVITEKSALINPHIANPLTSVGPRQQNIIRLSFLAGINKNLPSGQALAQRLINIGAGDLGVQSELRLHTKWANADIKKELDNHQLWDNTPLLLFILIEAEGPDSGGQRLGPLGSILLCEAIRASMQLKNNKNYAEHLEAFSNVVSLANIKTMGDLINFTQNQTTKEDNANVES